MASFETPADQHNFMEYFQQQQQSQQPFSAGSLSQTPNASLGPDALANAETSGASIGAKKGADGGGADLASPSATLMRSSASPSSYDHMTSSHGDTTAATTTASDSPSPSYQQKLPGAAPSVSGSQAAASGAGNVFAASHQIHPISTPVRHNSLPFDHLNSQQQQARFMAGPSSRQFSVDSPSSNPGSPSMMRPPPPPIQTGSLSNGTSPVASDFLTPTAPLSTSPSPLRTNLPFSTQSPETAPQPSPTATLPTKGEERGGGGGYDRSHAAPSQSHMGSSSFPSFANGSSKEAGAAGPMGTPTQGGPDGASGAASTKFVHKLFRMVSDAEYQHLISWNASGTSVVVTNFDEFAKEVLGKHFKHSNFSSFIRQLNM